MKKTLFFIVFIIVVSNAYSQKTMGLRVGLNLSRQHTENEVYDLSDMKNKYGITGNIILKFPMFSFMMFQPELGYTQKGARYVGSFYSYSTNFEYLELQTNFIIKSPYHPLYIITGGYASYCLGGSYILNNKPAIEFEISNNNVLFYDAGVTAGLGLLKDIGKVKSFIEARYNYGLIDINNKTNSNNTNIININRGIGVYAGVLYNI